MNISFVATVALIASTLPLSSALAAEFASPSGATVFYDIEPSTLCDQESIAIQTKFGGPVLSGIFYPSSSSGCQSANTALEGNFKVQNSDIGCVGTVSVNVSGDSMSATWLIQGGTEGKECSGAVGQTFEIGLNRRGDGAGSGGGFLSPVELTGYSEFEIIEPGSLNCRSGANSSNVLARLSTGTVVYRDNTFGYPIAYDDNNHPWLRVVADSVSCFVFASASSLRPNI